MERTFWIQGRTGRYWQNLENLETDQEAVVRLGVLISEDRYDELRLIQAQISAITGETTYTNIVTVEDGQVTDSPLLRTQGDPELEADDAQQPDGDRAGRLEISSVAPIMPGQSIADGVAENAPPNPQLKFWPTPRPEFKQGRLGLTGEENWAPDREAEAAFAEPAGHEAQAKPPQPAPVTGKRVEFDTGTGRSKTKVGGWDIPEETVQAAQVAQEAPQERTKRRGRAEPTDLRADPTRRTQPDAKTSATRAPRRAPFAARRQESGRRENTPEKGHGRGRFALMSGVFAGALATGLALSAISPDFAGRVFTGLSGQISSMVPSTSLPEAIANGDLPAVRARLAEGADPNMRDAEGMPVLLRAARSGNLAAVSLLLQAGADPTLPMEDGRSVLHRAAAEGRGQALQRMIDAGAPVDLAGGVYGCLTPLSVAAANGRVRAATILAENGASLENQNGCSVGPMEIATGHPHVLARLELIRAERAALVQATGRTRPVAGANTAAQPDAQDLLISEIDIPPNQRGPAPQEAEPGPIMEAQVTDETVALSPADRLAAAVSNLPESTAAIEAPPANEVPAAVSAAEPAAGMALAMFQPPDKPEPPPAPVLDPRVFTARLKSAIDAGDEGIVVALLGDRPEGFILDDARYAIEDSYGSGVRTALEQAALNGEADIVRLLADDGASIPPHLIHRVVQNSDRPELAGMLGVLLEEGADPNAMSEGLTPLMRASLRGDPQSAYVLMAFGANPTALSADGRTAADFAREAGRADLEERLVLAGTEGQYRDLMMGLSWQDTLATLRDRIVECRDIGDDFTACRLNIDTWLDDSKIVVAQFDQQASDRLVAIQIDSHPIRSPSMAMSRFDAVRQAIQDRVPSGHSGFLTTEIGGEDTLFQDLRPEINRGRYFSYWPDQERRRPAFIHLKLTGIDDGQGFYRIVIGNPFRAG